jgi:hypothetical protein
MKTFTFARIVFVIALAALAGGCKPEMPVSVSFRNARLDPSVVAQIPNNSDTAIKVVVAATSVTTGETKRRQFVIGGKDMMEFGWAQGWRFVSGESIRIHHAAYADLNVRVP